MNSGVLCRCVTIVLCGFLCGSCSKFIKSTLSDVEEKKTASSVLKRAKNGDREAQYEIGLFLSKPSSAFGTEENNDRLKHGFEPNLSTAIGWWEKAAAQGHDLACYQLGISYAKIAAGNDVSAGLETENEDSRSRDLSLANQRTIAAGLQNTLTSNGEPEITKAEACEKSTDWFLQSAQRGHANSMYGLGLNKVTFETCIDYDGAVFWWEKAAMTGDVRSISALGNLYVWADGPIDFKEAYKWLTIAKTLGREEDERLLNLVTKSLNREEVLEAHEEMIQVYSIIRDKIIEEQQKTQDSVISVE